jgi:hypothetical protein
MENPGLFDFQQAVTWSHPLRCNVLPENIQQKSTAQKPPVFAYLKL